MVIKCAEDFLSDMTYHLISSYANEELEKEGFNSQYLGRCKSHLYVNEYEFLMRCLSNEDGNYDFDGRNSSLSQFYDNIDLLGKIYTEYFMEEFGKQKVVYYHFDENEECEYWRKQFERTRGIFD